MKNQSRPLAIACLTLCGLAFGANADLLFSNFGPPTYAGGWVVGDFSAGTQNSEIAMQYIATGNFDITSFDAHLTRSSSQAAASFRLDVYDGSGANGRPGSLIMSSADAIVTPTHNFFTLTPTTFSLNHLQMTTGQSLWFVLVAVTDGRTCNWNFSTAANNKAGGISSRTANQPSWLLPHDGGSFGQGAFQVWGTQVPAPGSALLLFTGMIISSRRRKH